MRIFIVILVCLFGFGVAWTVQPPCENYTDNQRTIRRTLRPPDNAGGNGVPRGTAWVTNQDDGPDLMHLVVFNLESETRYTVWLTNSRTVGALPAQLLGEFTTRASGGGRFSALTEIIGAHQPSNNDLEDADGVADIVAAGALDNGTVSNTLDWIRIYRAENNVDGFNGSIFGGCQDEIGGLNVLSSLNPLP